MSHVYRPKRTPSVGVRYRTSGLFSSATVPHLVEDRYDMNCTTPGPVRDLDVDSGYQVGLNRKTWSTNTPDYWLLKKMKAYLPPNPFQSYVETKKFFGNSVLRLQDNTPSCGAPVKYQNTLIQGPIFLAHLCYFKGQPYSVGCIPAGRIQNLKDEVWATCIANRQTAGANLSEDLAEADKSYEMLKNPLENVIRFLRDYRRSGPRYIRIYRNGKAIFRLVSSEWLRFRYGISPLIADVKAAMSALEAQWNKKPQLVIAKANKLVQDSSNIQSSTTVSSGYVDYQNTIGDLLKIKAEWTDEYVKTPYNTLGLTFHNAVGLGWELTHFSFVVDWFSNIGDLIYANIPRVDIVPKGGCVSVYQEITNTYSPISYTLTNTGQTLLFSSIADYAVIQRIVKTREPRPTPDVKFVIRDDFRLSHFNRAADAIALIIQQLLRISPT